jgi:tetratricopeptide (TPR) repeat protein
MASLYVPKYGTYKEQKDYAKTLFNKAQEREDIIFFAPTLGKAMNASFSKNAWKRSLRANLYLTKVYPKEAIEDIDVLGRIGDSYFYLEKFNEAREWYENELAIFKKKYFKNKGYWEREGLTDKQALTEELKYLVNIQESIASCYTAVGEYKKGIEMHEATLGLMQDANDIDEYARENIFRRIFPKIGKLYKTVLKDYKKAFETYERMKNEFPKPFYVCEAEIYIGDTYLAMGNIEKAKEVYQAILDKYKYPGSPANYGEADERLKALKEGTSFVSLDRMVYQVKNGKVKIKY